MIFYTSVYNYFEYNEREKEDFFGGEIGERKRYIYIYNIGK